MRRRWLWGAAALTVAAAAVSFAIFHPGSGTPSSSAHVSTGTAHVELDMNPNNGSGPCNPVDTDVAVGWGSYQVAVCLSDVQTGFAPQAFQFDLLYDDTLNQCVDSDTCNPPGIPCDPTALNDNPNILETNLDQATANWDCNLLDEIGFQPQCDTDAATGPGHGKAAIYCMANAGPNTTVGDGISTAIAVVKFNAIASNDVDTMRLDAVEMADQTLVEIVECYAPGDPCYGGTQTLHFLCGYGDADCDGVVDNWFDKCRNTPLHASVDANGCSQTQVDQDSDGVCDPGKSSPWWCTGSDNCVSSYNPNQLDSDGGRRRPNGARIPGDWASNPAQDKLGDACDSDSDNDRLPDGQEFADRCPYLLVADSDGDSVLDGVEASRGFDPCDIGSKPTGGGVSDGDADGLNDSIEHLSYNTCASAGDTYPAWTTCVIPQDSDGDGCADTLEVLDLNGDRRVTVTDQLILAKRASGSIPDDDPDSENVFDVNKDGRVSVSDHLMMAMYTCNRNPSQLGCYVCPPE